MSITIKDVAAAIATLTGVSIAEAEDGLKKAFKSLSEKEAKLDKIIADIDERKARKDKKKAFKKAWCEDCGDEGTIDGKQCAQCHREEEEDNIYIESEKRMQMLRKENYV